jgi:hypothetical protein
MTLKRATIPMCPECGEELSGSPIGVWGGAFWLTNPDGSGRELLSLSMYGAYLSRSAALGLPRRIRRVACRARSSPTRIR